MRCWGLAAFLLQSALAISTVAAQPRLAIETAWGVAGKVVVGEFNQLRVTVTNTGDQPFDGELRLWAHPGWGPHEVRHGPLLVEAAYVSSGATREVVFYPRVAMGHGNFVLAWGDEPSAHRMLGLAEFESVGGWLCLTPSGPFGRTVRGLAALEAGRFPRHAAVLAGVAAIVLDHAPDLDPEQQRALCGWVCGGGMLHVLAGPDGDLPRFTGELAPLAGDAARSAFGMGSVVRHARPVAEVSIDWFRQEGWAANTATADEAEPWSLDPTGRGLADDALASRLRRGVQPHYPWGWILVCGLVYGVLVVVGQWAIARRQRGPLRSLGFLGACVVSFAAVSYLLGRAGHGDSVRTLAASLVQLDGQGHAQVTQWGLAFVRDFTRLRIAGPPEAQVLLAGCGEAEAVPGFISSDGRAGKESRHVFQTVLPLFAARSYVAAGSAPCPAVVRAPRARLHHHTDGWFAPRSIELEVETPPSLRILSVLVTTSDRTGRPVWYFELQPSNGSRWGSEFVRPIDDLRQYSRTGLAAMTYGHGPAPHGELFEALGYDLVQRVLQRRVANLRRLGPAAGEPRLDVFVQVEDPGPLGLTGVPALEGTTVYHQTFPFDAVEVPR